MSKSFSECYFECFTPLIVVKVLDITQMAEVKGDIRIDLSNQYHPSTESVSNADFIEDVCIPSSTITYYHKGSVYQIDNILND